MESTHRKRVQGWEMRLVRYIDVHRNQPFAWGERDCCSFAIRAARELTAEEIWDITWSTAMEAARAIEEAGGLVAAWTQVFGHPIQNWREVRRGDVGLVGFEGRDLIAVSTGTELCGPGAQCLEFLPLEAGRLFWRVG